MNCSAMRLAAVFVATTLIQAPFSVQLARAQDDSPRGSEADACFTAAERAQPLMKQKRLREARVALELCARDVCPRVARADCRDWLADVMSEQPTIVIAAHEVSGPDDVREITDFRAVIDGAIVIEKVDTTPIPIDPGAHRLRLERPGAEPLEQSVQIRVGEKGRVVNVYWPSAGGGTVRLPPQSFADTRPTPSGVYVAGVLGLAALGVGSYLEISGLQKRSALSQCQPTCPQTQVDDARSFAAAGDITIGAGLLLLASATIVYVTRPTTVNPPPPPAHVGWMVAPVPGGMLAGVRASLW
jgi:hypothetical protein